MKEGIRREHVCCVLRWASLAVGSAQEERGSISITAAAVYNLYEAARTSHELQ